MKHLPSLALAIVLLFTALGMTGCGLFDEDIPPMRVPSNFVGTWQGPDGRSEISFETQGTFTWSAGGNLIKGRVIFMDEKQITVIHDEDFPCAFQQATYNYLVLDDEITMKPVREYCKERANRWPGTWKKR